MAFKSNIDRTIEASIADMKVAMEEHHNRVLSAAVFWNSKPSPLRQAIGQHSLSLWTKGASIRGPVRYRNVELMYGVCTKNAYTNEAEWYIANSTDVRQNVSLACHKYNVRVTASSIGLDYWPALMNKTVSSEAYLVAESILKSQRKGTYGKFNPDGTMCRGGWDSEGFYGISSIEVDKYWYLSGCKPTSKFKWLVFNHVQIKWMKRLTYGKPVIKKGTTIEECVDILAGFSWVVQHNTILALTYQENYLGVLQLNPKVYRTLGRLSPGLRWAAVNGVDFTVAKRMRIRDLNWTAVQEVQSGKVGKLYYLPEQYKAHQAWYTAFKELVSPTFSAKQVIHGLHQVGSPNLRNIGVSPKAVIEVAKACAVQHGTKVSLNDLIPAYNLIRLFGKNRVAMDTFIAAKRHNIHDAGQIDLPNERFSAVWGGWIAAKPTLVSKARRLYLAEVHLGHPPKSLDEAVSALASVAPPPGTDILEGMNTYKQQDYEKLSPRVKTWEAIPAPIVDSIDRYSISQLAVGDIRAPMIGLYTDCCQHLHGAASECAKLSYTSPFCAVWVVTKGENIVAQALVWKSKDGDTIVLDSIEALGGYRTNATVCSLFVKAAQSAVGRLGVDTVLVSQTSFGMTRYFTGRLPVHSKQVSKPEPKEVLGYSDATNMLVEIARSSTVCGNKYIQCTSVASDWR